VPGTEAGSAQGEAAQPKPGRKIAVEANGLDVIGEAQRKGRPAQLFWPWFGSNVSVLGLSYGSFALGFGIGFWQALAAGIAGIVFSFLLCGFIAVAGKRGSAPTMVLSRAAFGVRGNRLPSAVSWILTVGWETVLVTLATLATATVFDRLGWGGGTATKIAALAVVAVLTVLAGVVGFDLIMRMQTAITVVTAVLTAVYIVLASEEIRWEQVRALPDGSAQDVIGALVFLMTGFGLGWVNAAADYARYLPRRTSGAAVAGWTTLGASAAPVVLLVFGLLLAGSSQDLSEAIAADPIGALTGALPSWFLVPFALVAVLGLVGGAVLDIYSSGLALLAVGVRVPRPVAAALDGVLMIAGTVYIVFFSEGFLGTFTGFLTTLGVPVAGWCGIMLADIALRSRPYDDGDLFSRTGRYGDTRWLPVAVLAGATAAGWGLVTNAAAGWLSWQGYLLGPLGLGGTTGRWASANLGVLVALALGFAVTLLSQRGRVRAQESGPPSPPAAADGTSAPASADDAGGTGASASTGR
jgi:purine-cytosine permease-like protein